MPNRSRFEHGEWYAVQVYPMHEKTIAIMLRVKGYEEFLPLRRVAVSATDTRTVALFPGYLFCRFNRNAAAPIITTTGILRILGSSNGPEIVDSTEIAAIRQVVNSELRYEPCTLPKIGERVRIVSGALSNVEGFLEKYKGRTRLVVTVTLLNRSVAVEVATDAVEVVKPLATSCEFRT